MALPAIADGRIVFAGDRLYAHALADGALQWASAVALTDGTFSPESSPALAYGRVYIIDPSGNVRAFNASDGTNLWSRPGGQPGSSVAVADGRVVVNSSMLLDAETGEEVAKLPTDCWGWATPVLSDGRIFSGRPGDSSTSNMVFGIGGPVLGEPLAD